MSVRFLLTAGLVLLLLCGCRRDPHLQVYIENVNAEKRMLEDTLYDLQYDYESKLREVEKLQGELSRLKGNGTGSSAPGTPAKVKSPSTSGGNLFPNIPDLKPPTVEPGTPADKTLPPDKEPVKGPDKKPDPEKVEPKEGLRELDNIDDLEPPKLELPEEQDSGPAGTESAEPQVTPPNTPPEKLASRWTPRSVRRPDPPRRRLNVTDHPDANPSTANSSGTGSAADSAPSGSLPSPSSEDAVSKQAHRPTWRPYR
ncbi:MAG: hypothetical protein ACYC3X_08320 [Pirellulaceae bacterium]